MNPRIEQAVPATASRRSLLQRSMLLTAGGAAGALLLGSPRVASAVPKISPKGQAPNFIEILKHEHAHVSALVTALGDKARPKPAFAPLAQPNYPTFANAAQAFEQTGVAAYFGASAYIDSDEYLAAATSIALIEARHTGFLNVLVGDPITDGAAVAGDDDQSFETPLTSDQIAAIVKPFIRDLNGGPPIGYTTTPSPDNDIAILNFALALEYLEREFYDINVTKFFGYKVGA